MVGPSLVPLLTLGIPGSPTAAVLLGGLLIHGIFPGPDLFTTHAAVTWTFIDSMLIGQILMAVSGIVTAGIAAKISRVPIPIMAAAVLILALFWQLFGSAVYGRCLCHAGAWAWHVWASEVWFLGCAFGAGADPRPDCCR